MGIMNHHQTLHATQILYTHDTEDMATNHLLYDYWILNWPPDGVNYEEVEDDEETERQEVDKDEKGGVVDVVQRLRPDSKHVNDGWRCFEAT